MAAQPVEQTDDTTSTDTDLENELVVDTVTREPHVKTSGKASLLICMVCRAGVSSKSALAFHLKQFHPERRPYHCLSCLNSFNNNNDLMSHVSNIHSMKTVYCKHCTYLSTSKAHMQLHVCLHTDGMKCSDCGRKYLNKHVLAQHKLLHQKRTEYCCTTCSKKFATPNSLQIHVKGKHGYGYFCPCGKRFESPAQHSRHQKKCNGLV